MNHGSKHKSDFPAPSKVCWCNPDNGGNGERRFHGNFSSCGGENGTRLEKVIVKPIGTNVATVIRFFATGTGMDTIICEQSIAATTASEEEALAEYIIPLDFVLPYGATLKASLGTTVAAGIQVTVFAGDY